MKLFLLLSLLLVKLSFLYGESASVVCVHGFMRSYTCMIPIGNTLQDEGYKVYLWNYPTRKKTIEGHAENLVKILNYIANQRPGVPIHFVTHSLGGVIVRAAVNHSDCPTEAKMGKAVLLAPPNRGSRLARFFRHILPIKWVFGDRVGQQLLNYSSEDMEKVGEFPHSMNVMVVAGSKSSPISSLLLRSPNDGKVTVDETRLKGPHDHRVLYVGHSWIMKCRYTIEMTKEFFGGYMHAQPIRKEEFHLERK